MKLRSLFLALVLLAVLIFAALNWSAIMAPTTLSLGFSSMEAPLGLILLGMLAVVTSVFLAYVVYLQSAVLLDTRRHAKELQANRELADQAEASRFTELRKFIEVHMQGMAARDEESKAAVLARLDTMDQSLRGTMEETGNSLAAYIGELDDRVQDLPPRERTITPLPIRREH